MAIKRIILTILLFSLLKCVGQSLLLNNTLQDAPQIGVLVANVGLPARIVQVVKDTLKSHSIRFEFHGDTWSGTSATYNLYVTSNGLQGHIELDVDSNGTNPQPWIDNYAGLISNVDDMLDTYPDIRIFVLDNEEMNTAYHTGTIAQYCTLATAIKPTLDAHNVRLANGGFGNNFGISCYTFRWLKANYNQDTADAYADRVFLTMGQYNAANNPGSNPVLEHFFLQVDTVMKCTAFDIMNLHFYEPMGTAVVNPNTETQTTTNAWRFMAEAFKNGYPAKRRQIIFNETGQRYNEEPDLVINMLTLGFRLGFLYLDWWSGNGTGLGATPLTEDDGTIKPNGSAYATWNTGTYGALP